MELKDFWVEGIDGTASVDGPALWLSIGAPGSGKTTRAREYIESHKGERKFFQVSRDELRTAMFGVDYHSAAPDWKKEVQVTHALTALVTKALNDGEHVYVDNTHTSPKSVRDLVRVAEAVGAKVYIAWFRTSVDICLERNASRAASGGRDVPEDVIRSMCERIDKNWGAWDNDFNATFMVKEEN